MKKLFILTIVLLSFTSLFVHAQVTFNDIAPILYNNCTKCHRPGEIGPFSLISYTDALSNAQAIKAQVTSKQMPPWQADRNYRSFVGERVLSQNDIDLIAQWVDGGAVQGNPNLAPPLSVFPTGSQLGVPDLTLSMTQSFVITPPNGEDQYRTFVLPTGLIADKNLGAIEVRPGNGSVVHHVLLSQDTTGTGRQNDQNDPGYGYDDVSLNNFTTNEGLGVWTPGTTPLRYPNGIGKKLFKASDILMQIHYPYYASGDSDKTSINLFFQTTPVSRYEQGVLLFYSEVVGNSNYPDALGKPSCKQGSITYPPVPGTTFSCFNLPPNMVTTIVAKKKINYDFSVMSVFPHQHKLGQKILAYAISPAGDTIPICKIDDWKFNWQDVYRLKNFVKVPKNSTLYAIQTYDNRASNPNNPNSPPRTVVWTENTTDEMNFTTFFGIPYQAGDELLSTTAAEQELEQAFEANLGQNVPNPASEYTSVPFYLPRNSNITLDVYDLTGRIVQNLYQNNTLQRGEHTAYLNLTNLPSGIYVYRLHGDGIDLAKRLVVK